MAKRAHHVGHVGHMLLALFVRVWSVVAFVGLMAGLILGMLGGIVFAALATLGRKLGGRRASHPQQRTSEPDDRRWHLAGWMRA